MVWSMSKDKTSLGKDTSGGADKSKLKIYMIDINENDKIVEEFNIKSVPTFYLYKTKKLVGQTGG